MLGTSRQQFRQHKQTRERDVIKESEGPSLAAHSELLRLLFPTIGTDICVVLSFNLLVAMDVLLFQRLQLHPSPILIFSHICSPTNCVCMCVFVCVRTRVHLSLCVWGVTVCLAKSFISIHCGEC